MSVMKRNEWQDLTRLTRGEPFLVERVRLEGSQVARLTMEDQVFVTAFVRCHGSIKEMEQLFGVSYPTVKNRLASIAGQLEFVDINPPASRIETLGRLEKGEITTEQALKILGGEP
jgi:hypothetical protein